MPDDLKDQILQENGQVWNDMIDMTAGIDDGRALGIVLCAIHERLGRVIMLLAEDPL